MRVLLLRPDPGNERFGLGPFFCIAEHGASGAAGELSEPIFPVRPAGLPSAVRRLEMPRGSRPAASV